MTASRYALWLGAIAALIMIGTALWHLQRARDGLRIDTVRLGTLPATVWHEADLSERAPVVVIAHGFAGSQQLMQPFAITLARNGFIAVTFDFPGHGLNPTPLTGGLADVKAMQRDLVDTLSEIADYAIRLPDSDGRLAIVGHSMAADVVVRYAAQSPQVRATVAVSLFLPALMRVDANNLLIVDGALEPAMLRDQALAVAAQTVAGDIKPATTYGNFDDGSARRVAYARGVEHIGVLYSRDSLQETLAWLDAAFGRVSTGFIDRRGPWLGLLLLGCILLAWPLSTMLPRVGFDAEPRRLNTMQTILAAVIPAIATPVLLWKMPTDFLPILLGDYLTLHFLLYGLLTLIVIRLMSGRWPAIRKRNVGHRLFLVTAGVVAFNLIAIGWPLDSYVFSFFPGEWRYSIVAVVLIGTSMYFFADEWLTRHGSSMRGRYFSTKLCFLASLVMAIALNLEKLFFLVIIVPVIILLFLVYGFFSGCIYRRTGTALIAAAANAVLFAWFIAVTFPLVNR